MNINDVKVQMDNGHCQNLLKVSLVYLAQFVYQIFVALTLGL